TWNTTTTNWLNSGTAAVYVNGQDVFFDDTATTNTVVISGTMTPDNVVFSNSNTYTFTAVGLSGSTSLTKLGIGTLNISGSDNYTGGTLISSGTIALSDANTNANGLGTGMVTLDGGTLKLFSLGGSSTSAGTFDNAIQVD